MFSILMRRRENASALCRFGSAAGTVVFLGLAACASDPAALQRQENEYVTYDREVAGKAKAKTAALEGLDRIAYPPCRSVRDHERVSLCGRDAFRVSLRECRQRAAAIAGPGAAPVGPGSPAPVVAQAGSDAASDADRLRLIDAEGTGGPQTEFVAIANGRETLVLTCSIDADMHLTDVS